MSGPVVILFDGVCNFCNATINFVIDRDPRGRFQFAAQQSEAGQRLLARHGLTTFPGTVVVIDGDRVYQKSAAAIRVANDLPWPWRLAAVGVVVPRFLRDAMYDLFAKHRYRLFGRSDQCRMPTPELRARFLA